MTLIKLKPWDYSFLAAEENIITMHLHDDTERYISEGCLSLVNNANTVQLRLGYMNMKHQCFE